MTFLIENYPCLVGRNYVLARSQSIKLIKSRKYCYWAVMPNAAAHTAVDKAESEPELALTGPNLPFVQDSGQDS
jgi:hypothetical protein